MARAIGAVVLTLRGGPDTGGAFAAWKQLTLVKGDPSDHVASMPRIGQRWQRASMSISTEFQDASGSALTNMIGGADPASDLKKATEAFSPILEKTEKT
jgi:hypothetical protein